MNKSESKYYNTALLMDEALLLLLEKKDYEFITVKEICVKAGVNRSTFYLHYESIDDLLNETLEMVSNKFFSTFDHKVINPKSATKDELFLIDDEYLIPYLKLIKTHKKIYKLIHNKPEIFNNQKASKKLYHELFDEILNKFGVKENEKEYVFSYFSYGVLAIVNKWIENDCNEEIEAIVNLIKRLIGYRNEN